MKLILPTLCASLLISALMVNGQPPVTGRVVDARTGKGIKDALVTIEGKKLETKTNILGFFQVAADSTENLVIQHEEYETGKIKVPAAGKFLLKLNPDLAPGYEGGMEEFYRFLELHLKYPKQAIRMGTECKMYVSFEVDSLQGIHNIKYPRIGVGIDEEVTTVLLSVPNKWITKVRNYTMVLPVIFAFDDGPLPDNFLVPPGKLLRVVAVRTKVAIVR